MNKYTLLLVIIGATLGTAILLIAGSPSAEQQEYKRYHGCVYAMATSTNRSIEEIQTLCR